MSSINKWFAAIVAMLVAMASHAGPAATEESHWLVHRVRAFKSQSEAEAELKEIRGLGVTKASVWVRPWVQKDDVWSLHVMLGPFASEQEALSIAKSTEQKTGKVYIAQNRTDVYPLIGDRSGRSDFYVAVAGTLDSYNEARGFLNLDLKGYGVTRASIDGYYVSGSEYVYEVILGTSKTKAKAELMIASLRSRGLTSAHVRTVNWDAIERMDDAMRAAQAAANSRAAAANDGSATRDFEYRQWQACVEKFWREESHKMFSMSESAKCGKDPYQR